MEKLYTTLGPIVQRVTLFGSRARGGFNPDADLDVLVVLEPFSRQAKEYIYDVTADLSLEYDVVIAPVVKDASEYARMRAGGFLLAADIEREGITLWPVTQLR